jgi:hypothetical protein
VKLVLKRCLPSNVSSEIGTLKLRLNRIYRFVVRVEVVPFSYTVKLNIRACTGTFESLQSGSASLIVRIELVLLKDYN